MNFPDKVVAFGLKYLRQIFWFCAFIIGLGNLHSQNVKTLVGAALLFSDSLHLIEGKRVGVITNHTSLLSNGVHLVDSLLSKRITVISLFSPEHGIRGDQSAGTTIDHSTDAKTNLPIYSLYGKTKKPTKEMLRGIDILLFDLQDVGARFYTYISTMFYCMEAASEKNIQLVILDRPNPITGVEIEGPIREDKLSSFIGIIPIPIRHGMTVGEIAQMINGERMLTNKKKCDLKIVSMKNWKRSMWFDETGLSWTSPSPNMKSIETAIVYPGTCLIEGTNVSEGRGTDHPFEYIGAPFIDGSELAKELNERLLPGVKFSEIEFTPRSIPGAAPSPKFQNQKCAGNKIEVDDRNIFQPVATGIHILDALIKQAGNKIIFSSQFDYLIGKSEVRKALQERGDIRSLIQTCKTQCDIFQSIRKKYLLYK